MMKMITYTLHDLWKTKKFIHIQNKNHFQYKNNLLKIDAEKIKISENIILWSDSEAENFDLLIQGDKSIDLIYVNKYGERKVLSLGIFDFLFTSLPDLKISLTKFILNEIENKKSLFHTMGYRKLLHNDHVLNELLKNTKKETILFNYLTNSFSLRKEINAEIKNNMSFYYTGGLFYLPFAYVHFDVDLFNDVIRYINQNKLQVDQNNLFFNHYTIFKIKSENFTEHTLNLLAAKNILFMERQIEFAKKSKGKFGFKTSSVSNDEVKYLFHSDNQISVNLPEYMLAIENKISQISLFKNKNLFIRKEKIEGMIEILHKKAQYSTSEEKKEIVNFNLTVLEKTLLQLAIPENKSSAYIQGRL